MTPSTPPPPDNQPLGAGIDFTDPASPLARWYARGSHVALAALLGALAFFYSIAPLWHTDIWGHLKFGEWMLEQGRLPDHEPFSSFADKEAAHPNFYWLGQVGLAGCFRLGEWLAGGDEAQRLAGGVAVLRTLTLALAMLFFWQLLQAYRHVSSSLYLVTVALLVYALLAPGGQGILRPQAAGVVFFAFLLARLSGPDLSWGQVALVVGVLIVWANLHGSFTLGLLLLSIFLAGHALSIGWKRRNWRFRRIWDDPLAQKLFVTFVLGAVATTLLNPHGPLLFLHALRVGSHPGVRTLDEWQPLNLQVGPAALIVYVASLVLLAGSWLLGRWRPSPTQVLLVLFFGLWAVAQRRMLVWWLPLVPWLALPAWEALARRRDWAWVGDRSVPSFRKTLLLALVAVVVVPWTPPVQWLAAGRPAALGQAVTRVTPWKLALQLRADPTDPSAPLPGLAQALGHYPQGHYRGRIFASETLADFLLWELPQEDSVVVYTHIHLFPYSHWQRCMGVKAAVPGWDAQLRYWGVNLVVVEADTHANLCAALRADPQWQVVVDEPPEQRRIPVRQLLVALRKQPL